MIELKIPDTGNNWKWHLPIFVMPAIQCPFYWMVLAGHFYAWKLPNMTRQRWHPKVWMYKCPGDVNRKYCMLAKCVLCKFIHFIMPIKSLGRIKKGPVDYVPGLAEPIPGPVDTSPFGPNPVWLQVWIKKGPIKQAQQSYPLLFISGFLL